MLLCSMSELFIYFLQVECSKVGIQSEDLTAGEGEISNEIVCAWHWPPG